MVARGRNTHAPEYSCKQWHLISGKINSQPFSFVSRFDGMTQSHSIRKCYAWRWTWFKLSSLDIEFWHWTNSHCNYELWRESNIMGSTNEVSNLFNQLISLVSKKSQIVLFVSNLFKTITQIIKRCKHSPDLNARKLRFVYEIEYLSFVKKPKQQFNINIYVFHCEASAGIENCTYVHRHLHSLFAVPIVHSVLCLSSNEFNKSSNKPVITK